MNMRLHKTVLLLFAVTATIVFAVGFWVTYGNYAENSTKIAKGVGVQVSRTSAADDQIVNTESSSDKQTVKSALLEVTPSGKSEKPAFAAAGNEKEVSGRTDGQATVESVQVDTMDAEQLKAEISELSLEIAELFEKAEWLKERGDDDEALGVMFQALALQGLSLEMSLRLEMLKGDKMAQRPDQRTLGGVDREQKDTVPTDATMENDAVQALQSQIQILNSEALRLGAIAEALTDQGDHAAARELTIMAMEYQTEALKSDVQLEAKKNEMRDENRPPDRPASIPIDESETYANEEDPADFDDDPAIAHLSIAKQNLRNDADYYYQKAEMLSDSGDEESVRKMTFLAIENQIDADLLQLEIDDIHSDSALQLPEINSTDRQEQF